MADNSKIEWTDASWQPVSGCSRKSRGCCNCYAERLAGTRLRHLPMYEGLTRMTAGGPLWTGQMRFNEKELLKPLKWKKPRRIFVCSMADLFHENTPFEWIDKVFAVMALCPQHTFQVLTKRPERMAEYLNWFDPGCSRMPRDRVDAIGMAMQELQGKPWTGSCRVPGWGPDRVPGLPGGCLPNVWLGTSVEDQEQADGRIPNLLRCPAVVRFLSCEPLLGPVSLIQPNPSAEVFNQDWLRGTYESPYGSPLPMAGKIDFVIVGGESGHNARPMHPDWARSLRDQCQAAGVAFFFKQWGEWLPGGFYDGFTVPDCLGEKVNDPRYSHYFECPPYLGRTWRVGKKAAGRLLDGREWNEFPEVRA